MYKKDKRGLSAVVTTLLIILLTIVAVGIIWVVIRNLVAQGSEQIEITTICSAIDLKATRVVEAYNPATGNSTYLVTLTRTGTGSKADGVKLSIHNGTSASGVLNFGQEMDRLETKTSTLGPTPVINGTRVDYTPFIRDKSGNEQLCPITNSFQFRAA